MIQQLLAKVVGTQNDRELKKLRPLVAQINALEPSIQPLSDEKLRGKTAECKQRVADQLGSSQGAGFQSLRRSPGMSGDLLGRGHLGCSATTKVQVDQGQRAGQRLGLRRP